MGGSDPGGKQAGEKGRHEIERKGFGSSEGKTKRVLEEEEG